MLRKTQSVVLVRSQLHETIVREHTLNTSVINCLCEAPLLRWLRHYLFPALSLSLSLT